MKIELRLLTIAKVKATATCVRLVWALQSFIKCCAGKRHILLVCLPLTDDPNDNVAEMRRQSWTEHEPFRPWFLQ